MRETAFVAKHEFRMVQEYPCPKLIAPFIAIVVNDAHATVESIYRGDDARALLNEHGHHSQYQLFHATASERVAWGIQGTPNRPGESTHEVKSDGRAFPAYKVGADLPWWAQGFDVADAGQAAACMAAASRHGWELFRPYPGGAEAHHLNFRHQPRPRGLRDRARVLRLRATLPRR